MITQLTIGIYTEGPTDRRYFPTLVGRYIETVLLKNRIEIELLDPIVLPKYKGSFAEQMSEISTQHSGLQAFFVHVDADGRDLKSVLDTRWNPWMSTNPESKWIPVIPIKMLESWMLADKEALSAVFIAAVPHIDEEIGDYQPESVPDPKRTLEAIAKRGKRNNKLGFEESLAKRTKLEVLQQLPSFHAFEESVQTILLPWLED